MRGRPPDPDSTKKMRSHRTNGYVYASTVATTTSKKTGKTCRTYIHWGTLKSENKFHPNLKFQMLSADEQNEFIFPDDWDISSLKKLQSCSEKKEINVDLLNDNFISNEHQFNNRLYGSIWFLIQIAKKYNVINDLNVVFEYENEIINNILTLAIFPYLTQKNFDRCAKWQRYTKTPSSISLTPSYITRLSQYIQDKHRMEFLKLRIERQPDGAFVACDSTTRSAWGNCLADIHWGKNKDNDKLKNTLEVVVYSLTTHEPIYYRTFPGNMSDLRIIRTVKSDLMALGIKDIVFMFDRGFESNDNFTELFKDKIPFIMCTKIGQEPVREFVEKITYGPDGLPTNMIFDDESELYCQQFKIENKTFVNSNNEKEIADNLYCNIYLNAVQRIIKLQKINSKINEEKKLFNNIVLTNSYKALEELKNNIKYHKLLYKKESDNEIPKDISLLERENIIEKDKIFAGFFSSVTYRNNCSALDSLKIYKTRDEQEKYFEQMKCQMNFHTQDCSSEDGKTGRLFILFIGLILSSIVRNTWRESVVLRKKYRSTYDLLDEMLPIRFCEYPDGSSHMTSFVSPQIEICREFGVEVPVECLPSSERRQAEQNMIRRSGGRACKKHTTTNRAE